MHVIAYHILHPSQTLDHACKRTATAIAVSIYE